MGVWSSLKSPVCTTLPTGVRMNMPTASGIEWFTAKKSNPKGPSETWPPPWISCSFGFLMLCSSSLPWMRPRVSLVPSTGTGRSRALSRYGQRAGVVFVTVGDDDAAQLVLALHDVGEVGQDEVDPGMVVVGEHDAGVDDDHVVPVLEDGHVLADPVQPAERDDAEAVLISYHVMVQSLGRFPGRSYVVQSCQTE